MPDRPPTNPGVQNRVTGLTTLEIYTDDPAPVNGPVGEIEIPAFLPRRSAQATKRRRRRISEEVWGTFLAHLAREHQGLPPDSLRVRPTLPRLRCLERPDEAAPL